MWSRARARKPQFGLIPSGGPFETPPCGGSLGQAARLEGSGLESRTPITKRGAQQRGNGGPKAPHAMSRRRLKTPLVLRMSPKNMSPKNMSPKNVSPKKHE